MERLPHIEACFNFGYTITGEPVILVISIKTKPMKILQNRKNPSIVVSQANFFVIARGWLE